jgi:hypothetical protein
VVDHARRQHHLKGMSAEEFLVQPRLWQHKPGSKTARYKVLRPTVAHSPICQSTHSRSVCRRRQVKLRIGSSTRRRTGRQ